MQQLEERMNQITTSYPAQMIQLTTNNAAQMAVLATTNAGLLQKIAQLEAPKTLKELRSFLGLAGYYRRFIRYYAKIAKPLTIHVRGENGQIKKNNSAKIMLTLDKAAVESFELIKQQLCETLELYQQNFNGPFELTTDANNFAIGAVLSQVQ